MKFFKFIVNFFKNNDTYLKQFNEKKCAHYDFCINNEYLEEYNVLILGNSISYHPESPNIGWVNTLIGGGGVTKIMECAQVL